MSRLQVAAAVLVLGLARVAGAGDGGWTRYVKDAGTNTCAKGLPRAYCQCITETLSQRYALDDYLAVEEVAKRGGAHTSEQTKIVAEDCLRRSNKTDADVHGSTK